MNIVAPIIWQNIPNFELHTHNLYPSLSYSIMGWLTHGDSEGIRSIFVVWPILGLVFMLYIKLGTLFPFLPKNILH